MAEPYCSIQTAIDNAVDMDEIVVAPGTYFEAINFLGKAITLRSSDGPEVTTIDGTGNFHVVQCVSDEGANTVLSGFVITGGNANGGGDDDHGGGMVNNRGSPTVANCTFSENTARINGGGMYNAGSSPTVNDCTFSGNSALNSAGGAEGGGMYTCCGGSPTVVNCTFSRNSAFSGGGMLNKAAHPMVINCTFTANQVFDGVTFGTGGGMSNTDASAPVVVNCRFVGNIGGAGAGMSNQQQSNPTVINCTFFGNGSSGMTSTSLSEPLVTNCIFWGNTVSQIAGVSLTTVRFSDVQGGFEGIGNIDADPLFVSAGNCCVFHFDSGCDDPDCVAAVCSVLPSCCDDFWAVECAEMAFDLCSVCPNDIRLQPGSPCIDAGDNTAVPENITTDLDGNPRFLEIPETPDTGNGTLPIVDMGAFESLGGGCLAVTSQEVVCHADGTTFTVSIEGLNACTGGTTQVTFTASGGAVGEELCFTALVNDGGFCCSTEICVTIPDCAPAALPSDLNGDGIVGMVDFLALLGAWGSCSDCGTPQACPADFDGDCSVGILDLLVLLGNWG